MPDDPRAADVKETMRHNRKPAASYARDLIRRFGKNAAQTASNRYDAAKSEATASYYEEVLTEIDRARREAALLQEKKSPAQLNRDIAEALAKPSTHGAKAGRHGYENGQRVTVLDYLGDEIGTGHVRSGGNYPASTEYFTHVTMTRDGETVTEEHPTRRVVMRR
jgi:hypothetical protein